MIKWFKAFLGQNSQVFKQMKRIWRGEDLSLKTVVKLLIIGTRL